MGLNPVRSAVSAFCRVVEAVADQAVDAPASVAHGVTRTAAPILVVGAAAANAGMAAAGAGVAAAGRAARTLRSIPPQAARAGRDLTDLGPERLRRRVWAHEGHAVIEVRGLSGDGRARGRVARQVRAALRGRRGVRWAEINAVTAQVLIAFDEQRVGVDQLVGMIEDAEEANGVGDDGFSWSRPEHPSDDTPLVATWIALAADIVGTGAGIVGRVAMIPPLHPGLRVPLAVLESYPRLRKELEKLIGPLGSDVLLGIGNAAIYGLSDGPVRPAVDAVYRLMLAREMQARRAVWSRRAPELCFNGDAVHDRAPSEPAARPLPYPGGPIEKYADRAALGSLLAASGVLAATRDAGRAADAILAGVPRAARLGREGFAAVLGRDLALRGVVPMNRAVLRRLDRISAVVVDAAVLCGSQPRVLSAVLSATESHSQARRSGTRQTETREPAVWRAASDVLRDRSVDDLRGEGPWGNRRHRLVREDAGSGTGPDSPGGMRLTVLAVLGQHSRRLGRVTVGCELDPLAEAVLGAARAGGARLLLTRHASVEDMVARVDEVVEDDLAGRVRALQAEGEGVLLVTGAHGALRVADVTVGCVRDGSGAGLAADLICGPGLMHVWRLLEAAGRARAVSQRAVTLAVSGSALGVLLAAVGPRRRVSNATISPVHVTSLFSLVQGA